MQKYLLAYLKAFVVYVRDPEPYQLILKTLFETIDLNSSCPWDLAEIIVQFYRQVSESKAFIATAVSNSFIGRLLGDKAQLAAHALLMYCALEDTRQLRFILVMLGELPLGKEHSQVLTTLELRLVAGARQLRQQGKKN